ncbi:MAG TPA: hypothetical protein PLX03_09685 [Candidatus Hydrogenedentes bacterium]|nr:hypothetical protein [Candidatus Hydrogenedentota bacterium]
MKIIRPGLLVQVSIWACCALIFSCAPPPPPPPPPETAGPQTAEEVFALISPIIQPLRVAAASKNVTISPADRDLMISQLGQAVAQYGGTEFGRQALARLGQEIADLALTFSRDERYRATLICLDAHNVLNMSSALLNRLGERAQKMISQPAVRTRGFLEDKQNGDLYAFLELLDRQSGKIKTIQLREGEESDGIRLLRIIGRNRGVRIEYLEIPGLIVDIDFERSGM